MTNAATRWIRQGVLCTVALSVGLAMAAEAEPTKEQIEAVQAGMKGLLQTYYPGINPYSRQKVQLFVLKNSVTDADLAKLPDVPFAFTLNFNGGIVTNGAVKELKRFKNLTGLDISGTQISTEGIKDLKLLPAVNSLHIDRFQAEEELLRALHAAGRLHILANIRAADGKRPNSAKDVAVIDVQGFFKINDACLQLFADFVNLESLNLGSTAVTDAGLKGLAGFAKLKTVELIPKPKAITAAGIEALQQAAPKLKIVRGP